VEGGDLQHVASKVGRLHLAKTRLSRSARRKLKKLGKTKWYRGLTATRSLVFTKVLGILDQGI
jgi:ribosomal protein S13